MQNSFPIRNYEKCIVLLTQHFQDVGGENAIKKLKDLNSDQVQNTFQKTES